MEIKPMIYQEDRKIELLYKLNYKDYNFFILNLGTHPTAYIEIPKGHKLYGIDYGEIDLNVHGGLTYSDNELMGVESSNWFIGWDYAHYGDYLGYEAKFELHIEGKKWTTLEIIKDCENAIDQIIEIEEEIENE